MNMELTPRTSIVKGLTPSQAKLLIFSLIGAMYVYVLWTRESFLVNASDPEWAHIAPFRLWLLPHGIAAAFTLLLGPFQFSERLRRRLPGVHKVMGYLYVAGCFIGAPLGIYIQWFEERLGSAHSFTMAATADAGVWIFATGMALWFIRAGKMQLHRSWMIRSFACAIVFLETRVIAELFHVPNEQSEVLVWFCVVAAFPLADLVLQIDESLRLRARRVRA